MPGLVKIKLRGSGIVIEVIPLVAAARVAGGTAEYVESEVTKLARDWQGPETTAMAQPERAVGREQNPPKRKK